MSKALLVIDMLIDFLEEGAALYIGPAAGPVREAVRKKVDAARQDNIPVIYLCDSHRPHDKEFDMFPPHCIKGQKGAQIVHEIAPRPEDPVIFKRRYSSFFGTDLDLTLRELNVKELELTGVCTQICILYTAADARSINYKVSVSPGAVASFDEEAHRFALAEMKKTLGVIIL
jgi:nicotinamidase/pyrazinamidase